ncbi:protein hob3 [Radiomyces spectabilis]|uniref:protein hob3 n=1 Tax=Radiomyces spectabilis TaxID=64574 RepID=UPI0022200CAC|nr:protein hob3 [Radiomyces spectabilis]KAI8381277.1 protein hob3 [Radiomyces spectabilis]
MSFLSGFKKNLSRAGTNLMQRTGVSDRTTDSEFDEEFERFKILEKKSEKLSKEAKGYLDSVRAMTAAQLRIAQTIENFYEDIAPMGAMGTEYKRTVEKLDEDARTDLDAAYRATVLEPLARFCSYFPEINEAVKRRNKKLLDYDSSRSKVRKLIDKPSEDPQRLPRAEQEANMAREMYENINSILITDLPKVVELRVPYFDPSFEALVKSQLKFAQTGYEQLEGLRHHFPPESDMGSDRRVDDVLGQMRELTICGNF